MRAIRVVRVMAAIVLSAPVIGCAELIGAAPRRAPVFPRRVTVPRFRIEERATPPGTVALRVIDDSTGLPARHAVVAQLLEIGESAVTDSVGHLEMAGVPSGAYALRLDAGVFEGRVDTVRVDATAGTSAIPDVPIMFTKWPNSVIGPGEPIPSANDYTHSTDYEGELAVVIGAGGRDISQRKAYDHVYGYTIVNDVTARTLQNRHKQWFLGKSLDGYCPMGPCIVTADEIEDVTQLRLLTQVNGSLRQDAYVGQLIFDIPTLIETLSRVMTLEPGDIIATGTCAGVGIGFDPPKYLGPGDVVAITIEPIGTLENPVS